MKLRLGKNPIDPEVSRLQMFWMALGALAALVVAMPILWPFLVKGLAWVVWFLKMLGDLPSPPH